MGARHIGFGGTTDAVTGNNSEINGLIFSFGCLLTVGGGQISNVVFCGLLGVSRERISR